MKKDSPIGFFDSGVGGLSVFSKFRKALPNENTLYFGDLKNLPYGNKSQDELIGFAKNIMDFFVSKDAKAVVIACNTSSALAYDAIKNYYKIKIYPIIQSCAEVIANQSISKIGVFATEGTVKSGAYSRELKKHNPNIEVYEVACPNWVSLVEGKTQTFEDIEFHLNQMAEFSPGKIILGCTHYPFLMNYLTKFLPKEVFIDPAEIFVEYIKKDLTKLDLLNTSKDSVKEHFFVSAEPELFKENSKLFYDIKANPTLI